MRLVSVQKPRTAVYITALLVSYFAPDTTLAAGIEDVFGSLAPSNGSVSVSAKSVTAIQSGRSNRQGLDIGVVNGHGSANVVLGNIFVKQNGNNNAQAVTIGSASKGGNVYVYLREAYVTQQGNGNAQKVNVGNMR